MKRTVHFFSVILLMMLIGFGAQAQLQIGTGTNTSQNLPINSYYGYTYSQQIYLATELTGLDTIYQVKFYFNGTSLSSSNDWTIYIGHTTKTAFASDTDWVDVANLTQVYSAVFTDPGAAGWLTFDITDFGYNGTDNIVVAIDENQPSYDGSSDDFYCTSVTTDRSIVNYSDGTNPDPTNPPSGTLVSYIPNLYLDTIAPVDNDIELVNVLGNYIGFGSGDFTVKAIVKNNGGFDQTNIPMNYTLDNGTVVTGTMTALTSGAIDTFTFATQVNSSTAGDHTLMVYSTLATDQNNINDTAYAVVTNTPLPNTENFDSYAANIIPPGWATVIATTSAYSYIKTYQYSSPHSGIRHLEIYNSSGSAGDLIAAMPSIFSGVANKAMKFWLKGSTGNDIIVGVMTDPSDATTFVGIDTIAVQTGYTQIPVDFSSYTGTGNNIAFKHGMGGTYKSVYIDDIEIYQPVPNEMMMLSWDSPKTAIDYTTGSVTVSVYNNGIAAQSNVPVSYSIDGGATYVNETIAGPINPTDTLQYTFTAAATFTSGINNCIAAVSNADAAPSNDTVYYDMNNNSIPYFTGFENEVSTKMPDGWTGLNTTGNASAYMFAYQYAYYAHNGSFTFKMYNYNSSTGDLIASLPEYGGTSLTDKWIKFWHRGYSSVDLIVGIMTDPNDATTFVGIDTITPPNSSYNPYAVNFGSYTGTGKYVSFKHGMNGTYKSLYIDDVTLEVAPTGPVFDIMPDSVYTYNNVRFNYPDTINKLFTVTNVGIGQLAVTAPALSGTNTANFILVDTNTYPKNLGLNETLSFEVRFFGNTIGSLTADLVVNTDTVVLNGDIVDPIISSFPYFENFDDQTVDLGWSLQGGSYKWMYDNDQTGSSNTGPMSDVTGGYYIYTEASSGSQGAVASIYTNPIDMTSLSNAKLNFWYHMYGATIDSLSIELAQNGAWTIIDTIIGQQQAAMSDPWLLRSIDLSAYASSLIDSIRFKAIRGASYTGDIAIDNIAFGEDFMINLGADTATCDSMSISLDAGMGATPWTYEWTDVATGTVVGTDQSFDVMTTGTYAVLVYDEGYFSGTDTINVVIGTRPIPLMSTDAEICEGDSIMVAADVVTEPVLFFSQYIEGSSNNKALEIYNASGVAINLDSFIIRTNYNGNPWSGVYNFPAGTILDAGDVFVIANEQADSVILSYADDSLAYNAGGYVVGFNGDDVRAICDISNGVDTVIVDIIGRYDLTDPGSGWDVAGIAGATKDHSLIRKMEVTTGSNDWDAIAGVDSLSSQYTVLPKNDFSGLGSHSHSSTNTDTYLWSSGETTASFYAMPTTTTTYTVTVSNTYCTETGDVVITVNAYPVVDLGADQTIKWTAGSVTLDAANAGMVYTWSTGETTQTVTYDNTNLAIGDTTISVVVDNNGCSASDTIVITVIDDVSIDDALNNVNVSIYPNPNSGQFTLAINGAEGNLNMEIVNLAGQVVYNQNIEASSNFTTSIDVSDFSTGVYYIKLSNNKGVKINKLIIK